MRRIVHGRHGVTVHSDRVEVKAKRAIVAVPPVLTGKIDYEPGLPDDRVELIDHYPQGTLTKAACVYDRPFWRDDGLTGQVFSADGPVAATFDDSPEDGSKGIVFGFIGGDAARGFSPLSKKQRRQAVIDDYVNFFGPQAATRSPTSSPPGRARPGPEAVRSGSPGIGQIAARGEALVKPVGRIHWAGTETSNYWAGYMDGAVRSGERAAAEVLERL